MRLQPYRKKVLPKVLSLLNEAEAGSHEFIPYGEESLRVELKGASSVLLATDDQDRITGFAYLGRQWYGETITLHVRPGPDSWCCQPCLLLWTSSGRIERQRDG